MGDYIIVGGGPSGLTIAWLLAKCGHKCTIIEKESTIGGCHRVNRIDGHFSEHGPRIYSSTYKTFSRLLKDMDSSFKELFTPYKFSISKIGDYSIRSMKFYEIMRLIGGYFQNIFQSDKLKKISMDDYTKDFSPETRNYIDELCRLTDGAGMNNYSVFKFLELMNRQGLETLYQPKNPNDISLFKLWGDSLKKLGVNIITSTDVLSINVNDINKKVEGVKITDGVNESTLNCQNVILAIPPKSLLKLTTQFNNSEKWTNDNSYIDYISITYQWNKKVPLERIWGFPESDWGVAHIIMSDYFEDYKDKTVISAGITNVDSPLKNGSNIGLTARMADKETLKKETLRQLRMSYDLPEPDIIVIGSDIGQNSAYIQSSTNPVSLKYNCKIKGLYNVGTQNGYGDYPFTSLESAVVNAHAIVHEIEPETQIYGIKTSYTLNQWIVIFIVCVLILIVVSTVIYKYLIVDKYHSDSKDMLDTKNIFL